MLPQPLQLLLLFSFSYWTVYFYFLHTSSLTFFAALGLFCGALYKAYEKTWKILWIFIKMFFSMQTAPRPGQTVVNPLFEIPGTPAEAIFKRVFVPVLEGRKGDRQALPEMLKFYNNAELDQIVKEFEGKK